MSTGSRRPLVFASFLLAFALALAGCTTAPPPPPPPPPPDPVIDPAGPVDAPVGSTVTFQVENIDGDVDWSVNGVDGGSAASGTIADGVFTAPARVPSNSSVTVAAADAADPTRSAGAEVTITATGTMYVLNYAVYVYNDMDTADGDIAPDRTFTIQGVDPLREYYDMTMAPEIDTAFVGLFDSAAVYRVADVSSSSGAIPAVSLSAPGTHLVSGLAYDAARDILYAIGYQAVFIFDGASTLPDGAAPTRILEDPTPGDFLQPEDMRVNLDSAGDRLIVTTEDRKVGVYDDASTLDGAVAPDRLIELDISTGDFMWGAAYDPSRDELYFAAQEFERGIYVLTDITSSDGLREPARTIAGPATLFVGLSQLNYDVANDRLVAVDANANDVKVFDEASTIDGDVAPTRIIGGANLPLDYPFGGYLDPTQ